VSLKRSPASTACRKGGCGGIVVNVEPAQTRLAEYVLPIFKVKKGENQQPVPVNFCGTGFVLESGIFVTCWHCVAGPMKEGEFYAAVLKQVEDKGLRTRCLRLEDLAQDSNGADLAVARIDYDPKPSLILADVFPEAGEDVAAYGYPLISAWPLPTADGRRIFEANARYLRGYVTQVFKSDNPNGSVIDSFEIDMPAPRGLSGSPLLKLGTSEVVGVVYGENRVESIVVASQVDPVTGDRTPETISFTTFALAHWTETLLAARGPALDGSPLGVQADLARVGRWSARATLGSLG